MKTLYQGDLVVCTMFLTAVAPNPLVAELARQGAGVHRSGAPERDESEVARVQPSLHADDSERPGHLGIGDAPDQIDPADLRAQRAGGGSHVDARHGTVTSFSLRYQAFPGVLAPTGARVRRCPRERCSGVLLSVRMKTGEADGSSIRKKAESHGFRGIARDES
jgi:hypothetical protein